MSTYFDIKAIEESIEPLVKCLGKYLPEVDKIQEDTVGYVKEKGHITGLGLYNFFLTIFS